MGADEETLWAQPVFSVGDATYSWSDVAGFARRGDAWDRLLREVREGLACQRAGHSPSPAAVEQAARQFRYQRRLITADETEAWLTRRALDVGAWMGYIRREVLRAEHADELADLLAAHPAAVGEVDALVWVNGWCGGHLEALSLDLAQRVAAYVWLHGSTPPCLSELDDVLERFRAQVATPDAMHSVVARRRLDWMLVELDEARFAHEDAAREAALSMRHDGLTMADVCALSGARHVVRRTLLEQLDGALHAAVLGAHEDGVLGPIEAGDGFVVVHVQSKTLPTIEDPSVGRRAAEAVTATVLRHEVEERVRWHVR